METLVDFLRHCVKTDGDMDNLLLKAIQVVRESTGPMRFVADWQEKLKAKGNDISQLDPNEATELLELIKGLSTTQLGEVFN